MDRDIYSYFSLHPTHTYTQHNSSAGCACWVEVRTRFLRPLCCGEGPGWLLSGLAGAQPVIQPLPAPPFPLLPAELPV